MSENLDGAVKRSRSTNTTFLPTSRKMSAIIRSFDWTTTTLGPIDEWPQSLKTATNMLLESEIPMVMLWDTDGYMIYNDAYAEFAGARHPALLGSKVLEGWPEVADLNRKVMDHGLRGETLVYDDQHLVLYRHGEPEDLWTNLRYSPIRDETGEPKGVLAIVVETTERVLAERRLASTRAQLDSALAIGLVSTWAWDINNDIVTGDANLARGFGISKDDLDKGLPLSALVQAIHQDDRERVSDAIQKKIRHGGVYEEEYRTLDVDGTIRWVIARGEIQKDETGKPATLIGTLIDITERKEAQRELEESKNKFDALFNSNVVAIAMANTGGDILQANETFFEMFGYSEQDLQKGLTSEQVTATSSTAATKRIYSAIETDGEAEPSEKTYVRKDGTEFAGIVGAARLPGSPDRFMAFIVDISENRRLRELNTIKDEFIALASHQLRTPASVVKQYIGIVMEGFAGEISDKQRDFLHTADSANDRQLSIINDLLKTAQIDSDTYELNLMPTDLVGLVRDVASQYEPTLQDRGQRLSLSLADKELTIPLDRPEMSICIANLIENASKYSPRDTTVTVSIKRLKSSVELSVADQGIGIDEKDQYKVFDKFTRVSNELSESVTGSGLGLYWVKRIVDVHKGDIRIRSKIGKGTTFSIRLPYD